MKLFEENNILELDRERTLFCPKCDSVMLEERLYYIVIDRCVSCSGAYFDKGELEALIATSERKGFFKYPRQKVS